MHKKNAWKVGKIKDKTGPYSFRVELANGQVVRCHVDQLRRNWTIEIETPESLDDPDCGAEPHGKWLYWDQGLHGDLPPPPMIIRRESSCVGEGVEGHRYLSPRRRPPDRSVWIMSWELLELNWFTVLLLKIWCKIINFKFSPRNSCMLKNKVATRKPRCQIIGSVNQVPKCALIIS